MNSREVNVSLSPDQALVFYEWLARTNAAKAARTQDQAEQRVLWDLEAALESQLVEPFGPDYRARLQAARNRVRDADS